MTNHFPSFLVTVLLFPMQEDNVNWNGNELCFTQRLTEVRDTVPIARFGGIIGLVLLGKHDSMNS
jgi:hypothetical protein